MTHAQVSISTSQCITETRELRNRSPQHLVASPTPKTGRAVKLFLELRANTALKEKFGCQSVVAFWMEAAPLFLHLFDKAVDILLPFATTYACDQAFSTLAYLKNKHRNRLNPAANMRDCALH